MRRRLTETAGTISTLPAQKPDRGRERFFDSNGVRLRYVTAGNGEPVVLLHGITRSVEADWEDPGLFGALAAEFQVIALDQRGHGGSGKPCGESPYGIEMVDDVIRLLDHLQESTAHVIGYSMGGRIALKLAVTAPARLRSVVLVGSGGVRHRSDTAVWDALATSLEGGGGIQPLIRAIWPVTAPPPTDEQLDEISRKSMNGNETAAIAAVARGFGAWKVSDAALRSNSVPALAILGSDDPSGPAVNELHRVMNALTVAVISGGDHVNTLESPAFIRTVKKFLEKQ